MLEQAKSAVLGDDIDEIKNATIELQKASVEISIFIQGMQQQQQSQSSDLEEATEINPDVNTSTTIDADFEEASL